MTRHLILIALVLFVGHISEAKYFDFAADSFSSLDFAALGASFADSSGIRITQQGDPSGSVIVYNQPIALANGFTTTFTLDITNCDSGPYYGADGFAFVMFGAIPSRTSLFAGGSSLGITTLSNFLSIPWIFPSGVIGMCGVNASTTLGGDTVSVIDNTELCSFNGDYSVYLNGLRCSGPHIVTITFTFPDQWEVNVENVVTFTFAKDVGTLSMNNYKAYLGFTGGVGSGYMTNKITAWSLDLTLGCLGVCDPVASCILDTVVQCTCPNGYQGDGTVCYPLDPPSAKIVPIIECFEDLGSGSYRAHLGYSSDQSETVVISPGPNNQLIGISAENLIKTFNPGRSPYYPLSAFTVDFNNVESFTWHLTDFDVYLNVSDKSKLCPTDNLHIALLFYTSVDIEPNPIVNRIRSELQLSYGRLRLFRLKVVGAKKRSSLVLADLELEIAATNSTTQNEPSAVDAVLNLVETTKNASLINDIINDGQTKPNDFIGVKTVPTGVETVGNAPLPPMVPVAAPINDNVPTPSAPTPTSSPQSTPIKPTSGGSVLNIGGSLLLALISLIL